MQDFSGLADLLPEALLLVDDAIVIRAANRAAVSLLGQAEEQLMGHALSDFVLDDFDRVLAYVRTCSRTRALTPGAVTLDDGSSAKEYRVEGALYRQRTAESPPLVLLRLTPKSAATTQFVALNQQLGALTQELERRKRYEATIHEQREQLRVTLSSIGDAVIATDTEANITFMNGCAEAMTGWSEADALAQPLALVFRIVNEYTRAEVESPVTKVLRDGEIATLANHTILLARDGRELPIDDCGAPIRDAQGRMIGAVLVFRDVAQRRALQRELERRAAQLEDADRRKNEYLAMLAHELRNPLAPLRNGVHVLRRTADKDERTAMMLNIMDRQVTHLSRLVGDLLDISRITRGNIELRRAEVDLCTVISDAIDIVRPTIDERQHDLHTHLLAGPLFIQGDSTRLAQVFSNLLDNAAKYTQERGRIDLYCERVQGLAVITLRDNGIGIARDLLPYIFDLFTQGDATIDRRYSGLGLGLTLVKRLVELHGGTVTAASGGAGQGSEFVVRLPLVLHP
jgi:PAS domain S-box-containing protein